jgi:hypothetical protein
LRTLQDVGNYIGGAVWLDTASANTGSTFPEDGTFLNPVNTLARALTVAAAATQAIKRLYVMGGSSITLASTYTGWQIDGENYTLALGGQDITNTKIIGASSGVSGIATGTFPFFKECSIGSVTVSPCAMQTCGFTGTITVGGTGDYYFIDCFSQVAGTSAPVLDMAGVGATNVSIRRWSGGLTINNIATGDVISIDAVSGGTITLNGADGNVQVRGMVSIVDNRTGLPTLGSNSCMDSRFDAVDSALTTIDDFLDTEIAALTTAVADVPTVAEFEARTPTAAQLAYIVANAATGLPVTFTTSGGSTTAAVLNQVDGAAASATNDQYNGRLLVFTDGTLKGVVTDITDYVGGTTTATITAIPFAPTSSHNARLI